MKDLISITSKLDIKQVALGSGAYKSYHAVAAMEQVGTSQKDRANRGSCWNWLMILGISWKGSMNANLLSSPEDFNEKPCPDVHNVDAFSHGGPSYFAKALWNAEDASDETIPMVVGKQEIIANAKILLSIHRAYRSLGHPVGT